MKPLSLAAICLSCLVGSALGSWLALRPGAVAHAQNRLDGIQAGRRGVESEGSGRLVVPDDGLVITGSRSQLYGRFVPGPNGLSLILLNGQGQPSVSLEPGPGGQVALGAAAGSAGFTVQNQNGLRAGVLVGTEKATVFAGTRDRRFLAEVGNESSLTLPGRAPQPVFSVKSLADGASLAVNSRDGREMFGVTSNMDQGDLSLVAPKEKGKFSASGRGDVMLQKNGTVLWDTAGTGAGAATAGSSTGGKSTNPPGSDPR